MFIFVPLFTILTLLMGGYAAKRIGVLKNKQSRAFLDFTIIFALPCLIFERTYHLSFDFSLIVYILIGLGSCAVAGFVRKMSGTSEVDTDIMNLKVSKMVEEALKYNQVESVFENGDDEDIFSPEYFEKLSDIKMPATKLELLVKTLRKQIKEYAQTNQIAAKSFEEMLEKTIEQYHERRKHLESEEAGEAQERASEDIIKNATQQALEILAQMKENKESFRKMGLTFEEKAFYDILIALRDEYNFGYGVDKNINGVVINDKCKTLAKKVKEIIDTKSSFADWLNNQNVRDSLKIDIKVCLVKNGYPPQYSPEVFSKVMEQVENFEEYRG